MWKYIMHVQILYQQNCSKILMLSHIQQQKKQMSITTDFNNEPNNISLVQKYYRFKQCNINIPNKTRRHKYNKRYLRFKKSSQIQLAVNMSSNMNNTRKSLLILYPNNERTTLYNKNANLDKNTQDSHSLTHNKALKEHCRCNFLNGVQRKYSHVQTCMLHDDIRTGCLVTYLFLVTLYMRLQISTFPTYQTPQKNTHQYLSHFLNQLRKNMLE
eukprot:TRINITY_DN6660_c0_g1_i1.p3 TRINITY_DN6660_c0_g1~~TRINITY_DN6660_c0_g1_i1.p3  ORF type:complete len:214 (-),score=-15.04 TRINITY_DN6660_c0_g1_i1:203-844(-)